MNNHKLAEDNLAVDSPAAESHDEYSVADNADVAVGNWVVVAEDEPADNCVADMADEPVGNSVVDTAAEADAVADGCFVRSLINPPYKLYTIFEKLFVFFYNKAAIATLYCTHCITIHRGCQGRMVLNVINSPVFVKSSIDLAGRGRDYVPETIALEKIRTGSGISASNIPSSTSPYK